MCKADESEDYIHTVETIFFAPVWPDGIASCSDIKRKIDDIRNLDFPMQPLVQPPHFYGQENLQPLNLNKVRRFNEVLFGDLYKRDL
jgi:hypothetical protein